MNKQCTQCSQIKSIENFGKDRQQKDGYRKWCKDCRNKYMKLHYIPKIPKPSLTVEQRQLNRKIYYRKWSKENYVLCTWHTYRKSARNFDRIFDLTIEQVSNIIHQPCHYCGTLATPEKVNGIDRKDNNMGYVIENCLPCCATCNKAKSNNTYDNFIRWIEQLSRFYNKNYLTLKTGLI